MKNNAFIECNITKFLPFILTNPFNELKDDVNLILEQSNYLQIHIVICDIYHFGRAWRKRLCYFINYSIALRL